MHSFVRSPYVMPGLAPLDYKKPVNQSLAHASVHSRPHIVTHMHISDIQGKGRRLL
jgi:hypothetical protein